MLRRALSALREAEDAPRIADASIIDATYRKKRNQVLVASMVGYALFYFCRNDLSIALPLLQKDLGISDGDLGSIGSRFFLTYGVFKFLTGLVADRSNPRTLMVAGLVASACLNVAFGLSSSIALLGLIWAANGFFQSAGAPASAKVMAVWFSAGERGTKTGIWNISHQGGGGLVLFFAGVCAHYWGWRGAMIVPAIVALVGAVIVLPFIHDRPESEGLPPIEEWRPEDSPPASPEDDLTFGTLIVEKILLNPRVLTIAAASFCTYCVRYGALVWIPKYLMQVRSMDPAIAGSSASLLEFLGIPGALACGWLSDRLHARRAPIVAGSLVLLAASTWRLYEVPAGHPVIDLVILAAIGFFTYGPQMLLAGVAPVDMSSKRVAAAAVGFTGLMSYLGASVSSSVTGWLLQWGNPAKTAGLPAPTHWGYAFAFWAGAAVLGALLCIPLWGAAPVRRS